MESSLEWLRKIGVNLKKIYDAILDSTFGLPAIKQAIDDIVIDFRPITDKIDQSTEEIINKIETTQPDLSAVAKEETLTTGISEIKDAIDNINFGPVEEKVDEIKEVVEEIDTNATANKEEILQAINDIAVDLTPITDKLDEMDEKIDTNTQTLLDAIADIHINPITNEHIISLFEEDE